MIALGGPRHSARGRASIRFHLSCWSARPSLGQQRPADKRAPEDAGTSGGAECAQPPPPRSMSCSPLAAETEANKKARAHAQLGSGPVANRFRASRGRPANKWPPGKLGRRRQPAPKGRPPARAIVKLRAECGRPTGASSAAPTAIILIILPNSKAASAATAAVAAR